MVTAVEYYTQLWLSVIAEKSGSVVRSDGLQLSHIKRSPLRIALIYGVVGALWVAVSDQLLSWFTAGQPASTVALLQTLKGWVFILISVLLIWALVKVLVLKLDRVLNLLNLQNVVIANTHNGIVSTDAHRRVIYVNSAYCEATGYRAEDVVGLTLEQLRSGNHDEAYYQAIWQTVRTQGVWRGEIVNRRKDGSLYHDWMTLSQVTDDDGNVRYYVAVLSDITEQKTGRERLRYLAFYDPLTDLPNRALASEHLATSLRRLSATVGQRAAVLFIDIDDFKTINESHGHPMGDQLLRLTAERLADCLDESHYLGRFGGDEFLVVMSDTNEDEAERLAMTLLDGLSRPFELTETLSVNVRASIGICLGEGMANAGQDQTARLFSQADSALQEAKRNGKNIYAFYHTGMTATATRRLRLETALNGAITRNELRLYYQPVFELASGRLVGSEALVRWQHPEWGLVSPGDFIPLAESTGMIVDIGEWVLAEATRQQCDWLQRGWMPGKMAVNVSFRQIARGDLDQVIMRLLSGSGIPPECLELELTESGLIALGSNTLELLREIRDTGVTVAIDDFGTGYSSLAYLRQLPVDKLKIDRSFVSELVEKGRDQEIVQAVVAMAKALRLQVQAEGVETETQRRILRDVACDTYQGYLSSPPVPADEFEARFLAQSSADADVQPGPAPC